MADGVALVIIDVQMGMFEPEPVHDAKAVLQRIGALADRARRAGVPVIYVQHTEPGEWEPGTGAWPIQPAIAPHPGEPVVQKRTCDSFHETDLQSVLAARGVHRLVMCGMQSEYCVDTSVRRAFSLGYDVTLVADGHSTFDGAELTGAQIVAHHNRVLGGSFAKLLRTEEIAF